MAKKITIKGKSGAKTGSVSSPVDPVYRLPDMEVDTVFLVERALEKLSQFQADRQSWLSRREEFYLSWDDYISPVVKGAWAGSSNLHLPTTEIHINQMHARIMQSIFFAPIPFFVDPQEDMDELRVNKIYNHMKYILMRYCNYHKGIFNAIDDWAMDLCTDGMGILARGWDVVQRRFLAVEENEFFKSRKVDLERAFSEDVDEDEFLSISNDLLTHPYIEKMKVRTAFNGPTLEAVDPVNVLFKGDVVDSTDLDRHETVIRVCYFTRNQLLAFKDSQYFDEEVVDIILDRGPDKIGGTVVSTKHSQLITAKDSITGINTLNSSYEEDSYEFICVFDTVNPRGKHAKEMADRIIYYVHPASKQLARWTFLDRVSSTGKINLHLGHLFRRPRRSTGRGIVETLYSTNRMQDILINQSIDAGTLANTPMGVYRGGGSFDPEEFQITPGMLFKTDDPNQDVRLLTWPINPNWSTPVQALLSQMASQLTSLGPQASGTVSGAIGPLRSAAGVQALNAASDINHDVLYKRINGPLSEAYEGLYADCLDRMPTALTISVVGMDGIPELNDEGKPVRLDVTKEELRSKVHFGLYANSSNMNRQAQLQMSIQMSQMLFQKAAMVTNVVGPNEIYEVLKDMLMNMGKQRIERFIKRPGPEAALPLGAELFAISQGIMPQIVMADPEHEAKISKYQEYLNQPDQVAIEVQNGQLNPRFLEILKLAIAKHEKFLEALNAVQSQQGNPTGAQQSITLGLQGGQEPEPQNEQVQESQFTEGVAPQGPNQTPFKGE